MPGIIPERTTAICEEVMHERMLQDNKWGEQNHDPFTWLAILGEEVGEANEAALDANNWRTPEPSKFHLSMLSKYREELVQVAAVAVAMIECLDRDKWNNKKETT